MSRAEKIQQLQKQTHNLMVQFSQAEEPGGYYGLRLAGESLQLAYYAATKNIDGIIEEMHLVLLALDDFENFVVTAGNNGLKVAKLSPGARTG